MPVEEIEKKIAELEEKLKKLSQQVKPSKTTENQS